MAHLSEQRRGPDRRRRARGGRRASDRDGFAPLVMLVGDGREAIEGAEAILAWLHFAVATAATADDALRTMPDLRPDLVVASEWDSALIRGRARQPVTVIVMDRRMQDDPEALIDKILKTIRSQA
jgi:CheY-like chemotaxis protein